MAAIAYLTLEETKEALKISRGTVYSLIRKGSLTPHRLPGGRRVYFSIDQINNTMVPKK